MEKTDKLSPDDFNRKSTRAFEKLNELSRGIYKTKLDDEKEQKLRLSITEKLKPYGKDIAEYVAEQIFSARYDARYQGRDAVSAFVTQIQGKQGINPLQFYKVIDEGVDFAIREMQKSEYGKGRVVVRTTWLDNVATTVMFIMMSLIVLSAIGFFLYTFYEGIHETSPNGKMELLFWAVLSISLVLLWLSSYAGENIKRLKISKWLMFIAVALLFSYFGYLAYLKFHEPPQRPYCFPGETECENLPWPK